MSQGSGALQTPYFVGRLTALAALRRAWEAACSGRRSIVWIAGEPGIGKTRFAATLAEGERLLRATLDPEATDARAKRRQAELLAQFGGRDEALARGDLGFTPAPGTAAEID